jgi:hypothetical protein
MPFLHDTVTSIIVKPSLYELKWLCCTTPYIIVVTPSLCCELKRLCRTTPSHDCCDALLLIVVDVFCLQRTLHRWLRKGKKEHETHTLWGVVKAASFHNDKKTASFESWVTQTNEPKETRYNIIDVYLVHRKKRTDKMKQKDQIDKQRKTRTEPENHHATGTGTGKGTGTCAPTN